MPPLISRVGECAFVAADVRGLATRAALHNFHMEWLRRAGLLSQEIQRMVGVPTYFEEEAKYAVPAEEASV